jgi:hypothetical protein
LALCQTERTKSCAIASWASPDSSTETLPIVRGFRQGNARPVFFNILRPRNSTARIQKENERISTMPFLLWHFSPGDKIENCSAQFLGLQSHISSAEKLIWAGCAGIR